MLKFEVKKEASPEGYVGGALWGPRWVLHKCNTRSTIIWRKSMRVVEVECPVLDLYFVKKRYDANKDMMMI